MGSVVARLVREASTATSIVMVDGGPPIGAMPGLHVHDTADPQIWAQYNSPLASGIQSFYTGVEPPPSQSPDAYRLKAGLHLLSAVGNDTSAMPAAAAAWNVGGMGAHWTAVTPWPAGTEVFDHGDPGLWQRDLNTARRALGVTSAAIGPTLPGEVVLAELRRRYRGVGPADRAPQLMPMAVTREPGGRLLRTGPSRIFPPLGSGGDSRFTLLPRTLAVALDHDGRRVRGAVVLDVETGDRRVIEATATVVCADAFRTPQLLFASGIRPPALGRYLNEHAFLTGRVLLDLDRFGLDRAGLPRAAGDERNTDSLWLPQNGPAQPFHGQIMNTTYVDPEGLPLAHAVGLSLFSPVETRPENGIRFSEDTTDVTGMPSFEIEFGYTDADLNLIGAGRSELRAIAERFGDFDPGTESALLPPGSSLHLTGTVRMGTADDGTSVCDPYGQVWAFDNLYLAGNGVVPTAVVGNSTLTGTVTAVRAARAALRTIAA
ncbi:choline dehydrogenase [Micromonospora echinospora]|nr:choline dehydrogenase [Micromonospora echinospora]